MKPIHVSVRVARPREEVFEFLDVLSNHVCFTDHMLTDWSFSGASEGVGSKARLRANVPGPAQWVDMEVVASQAPLTTTEEAVGAGGRRRTRGTYVLEELPGGETDVGFTLEYLQMPPAERIFAPLARAYMKRANAKAMRRLGEVLHTG